MPRLSLPEDIEPRVEMRIRPVAGRHSGGAWKVAYADFTTAMMALFIVLWLMNASPKVKSSISGYFKDPRGFSRATLRPKSPHCLAITWRRFVSRLNICSPRRLNSPKSATM